MFRFWVIIAVSVSFPVNADDAENNLLEVAARKYRLSVYASYRNQRKTYDDLVRTGQEALAIWEQNQHPRNADLVAGWFVQATESVRNPRQPLPPLPTEEQIFRPKKQRRQRIDSRSTAVSTPWPSPPDRRMPAEMNSAWTIGSTLRLSFLLTEEPIPFKPTTAEIETQSVPSPIPAHSIQQDPQRREFGSSIDLNMLIARIESENLRLKLLEERLIQADTFSTSELNLVTGEFSEIVEDRRLTNLYWLNLPHQQKQIAPRPLSLKPIQTVLHRLSKSAP